MPNILLKIPKGCFSTDEIDKIAKGVTNAAHAAESVPDDPKYHVVSWLMVEEVAPEHIFIGGQRVVPARLPIIVSLFQPEGVLDMDRRRLQSERINTAIRDALGPAAENVLISCIMTDVPDGHWGANGQIWTLPTIAQVAGFQHLSHLREASQ